MWYTGHRGGDAARAEDKVIGAGWGKDRNGEEGAVAAKQDAIVGAGARQGPGRDVEWRRLRATVEAASRCLAVEVRPNVSEDGGEGSILKGDDET